MSRNSQQPLLLLGADGMLGSLFARLAAERYRVTALTREDLDICDSAALRRTIIEREPEVIVNCTAWTDVDGAETQEDQAMAVNATAVGVMAESARAISATLVHVSTDYVFAGDADTPYDETAPTAPVTAYGRSKLAGEEAIVHSGLQRYFIIRTSWLYGPGGGNFVDTILRLAAERESLQIVADQTGSPTYTGDLAEALLSLLQTEAYGLYHFSNDGQCSWYGFACAIVEQARQLGASLAVQRIEPVTTAAFPRPAPRPAWSLLSKEKYRTVTQAAVPEWQASLHTYLRNRLRPQEHSA